MERQMVSQGRLSLLAALIAGAALALAGGNMIETSAQSGSAEPQVASAGTKAVVTLDRAPGETPTLSASESNASQHVLTLEVTLVKDDPNAPVALEITSPCADSCPDAQTQPTVTLGQISLFPALRAGEKRRVELQLDADEASALSGRLGVELKPVVDGRGVGGNAIAVNSATIERRGQ
jgi:hypothetical protein